MMEHFFLQIPSQDRTIELEQDHYTIGRSETCDIVIKDPTLSRTHAELTRSGSGWTVRDCHSTNGVSVNGSRINPDEATLVRPGDSMLLGSKIALQLTAEEEDEVQAAPVYVPQPSPRPAPQPTPQRSHQPAQQQTQPPVQSSSPRSASGNAIRAKIEEAQNKGKACIYAMVGLLILGLILCVAVHPAAGMLVLLPIILVFLKYNEKYSAICNISKIFPQTKIETMLSGTWDSAPSNRASGVYCGEHALFSEKSNLLLPYENLAWIYQTETKTTAMAVVTVSVTRSVNFCYRDGKQFTVYLDENELKNLLNNRIIPLNPDILIGYTQENRMAYARMTGRS